jgi:signal peptidase
MTQMQRQSSDPDSEPRSAGATGRRVLSILGILVLIAFVVPFVIFAVPQVVGANHGFVILSGSMEPAISPGDVVIVDGSRTVEAGDVITFDDGGEIPTTHRVTGVDEGRFVTQGDANEDPDSATVAPEAVLGEVSLVIPLIGYVILWVNTPLGYVALVLVPIGLLLVTELLDWARADDESASAGDDDSPTAGSRVSTDGPTPAIRHVGDVRVEERADVSESTPPAPRRGVAMPDLLLTTIASAILLGYAGWNVYTEITTTGAPSPVSMAAATAGLFGVVGGGWMALSVWLATRRAGAAATARGDRRPHESPQPAPAPQPDGGTEQGAER